MRAGPHQWNPVTDSIEVVNNHASDLDGLTASAAIVNFDGEVLHEQSEELSSRDDSTLPLFPLLGSTWTCGSLFHQTSADAGDAC